MPDTRPRHRHFIVLPLFLLLAAASVSPAFFSGSSLTASVTHAGPVQELGNGVQARVEGGGKLQSGAILVLEEGSALFRTDGIAQVRTPAGSVLALAGAFHIVVMRQDVTVSAITAPVFVTLRGHFVLVPMGMQYRVPGELPDSNAPIGECVAARRTMPLPEYFLKDQLQILQTFPPSAAWLPIASALPSGQYVEPHVQLPAAQAREREQWRVQVLGALRAALNSGEASDVRKILQTKVFEPALAAPQSLSVLVALASRPQVSSGVRASLLTFLLQRHDLWLLAAVHPVLRGGSWTAGMASLTPEEEMLLAFGLPSTDRNPEGYAPVQLAWWAQSVARLIAAQKDPVAFVTELLKSHIPMVQEYMRLQYPERAQILAGALVSFAKPVHAELSSSLLASLAQAERLADASFIPFDFSKSASSTSSLSSVASAKQNVSPASSAMSPEERIGSMEAALEQAGALFSLQTTIEALPDGQSVRVSGIFFASSAGDRSYAFDVNVAENQVSSIVQDGKLMPYPMDLAAFLSWVRK